MPVKVGTPHSFHYFPSVRALIIVLLTGLVTSPTDAAAPKSTAGAGAGILHVRGTDIVDGRGRPVLLRGVAFGNLVWNNVRLPRREHDEADYQRVAAMGMNAVRFYMNYRTFENDAAPGTYLADGWQWLDDNIAWAKRHGVYLILNMHVPPGGFQSLGNGKALWDRPEMQDRLIALWTAIASHCKGEATVAGYDLLNEPVVTKAASQWHDLAARIAAGIRTVDGEHMLFVERLNSIANEWSEDDERGFFRIPDANTVYEFHFYKPFHFTHQGASWVPFTAENVRYPDTRAEVEWFLLDRKARTEASPKLPPGDSPWTYYEGAPYRVDDPAIVVGKPLLIVKANSGKVWFDDLTLEELNADGKTVKRVIWRQNLTGTRGWYFWNKSGKGGAVRSENGHDDGASIVAAGTAGDANLGADVLRFRTSPGATYRLSGWMRGEKVPPTATCQIALDFFTSRAKVHDSDRAFVEQEVDAYVAWGKREKVPLFLGEWGAIRFAFDQDRGGLRWVKDMLDIMRARKLSFTYHAYHEDSFGLYRGGDGLPDPANANKPLIDLFSATLKK
jgi:endoglucanase